MGQLTEEQKSHPITDPSQIRVGNYVYRNRWGDIEKITTKNIRWWKEFYAIEITDSWLIDLGFAHVKGDDVWEEIKVSYVDGDEAWWISGLYYVTKNGSWWVFHHSTDEDCTWQVAHPKYIHQLQNVYQSINPKSNGDLTIRLKRHATVESLPDIARRGFTNKDINTIEDAIFHVRTQGVKGKGNYYTIDMGKYDVTIVIDEIVQLDGGGYSEKFKQELIVAL
jgi:hypothetical protein